MFYEVLRSKKLKYFAGFAYISRIFPLLIEKPFSNNGELFTVRNETFPSVGRRLSKSFAIVRLGLATEPDRASPEIEKAKTGYCDWRERSAEADIPGNRQRGRERGTEKDKDVYR